MWAQTTTVRPPLWCDTFYKLTGAQMDNNNLLRCLIIVLLALLFARPLLEVTAETPPLGKHYCRLNNGVQHTKAVE